MEGTFSVGCMIFSKNIKVWPNIGCWWKSIPGIVGGRRLAGEIPGLSQQRGTTAKSAKKQTYQIVFSRKYISKKYRLNRTCSDRMFIEKHCQRHNGPEGWLLTKVTSLGHITSSYTNLDQTSSKSRPSTNSNSTKSQPNISISTKLRLKNLQQTYLQNLDQDWTS